MIRREIEFESRTFKMNNFVIVMTMIDEQERMR